MQAPPRAVNRAVPAPSWPTLQRSRCRRAKWYTCAPFRLRSAIRR
ncbi:Hypothetical protein I596_3555 [Dokdonella koreensis DS-123]|uniref:Uncharacterized protein n=1 Tax=Dokdonella koreensis DS-123 TaxID=1300342 RepID=A0A160DZC9_9GAMM|nr:Hypothetical protein I596_3555 [Dokdonella koreensis DS-123]